MRIDIVNFRSICKGVYEFKNGVNLLKGKSGKGKTTIIEAYKWCLYGSDINSPEAYRPFGATMSTVTEVKVMFDGYIFIRTSRNNVTSVIMYDTNKMTLSPSKFNSIFGSSNLFELASYIPQKSINQFLLMKSSFLFKELVYRFDDDPSNKLKILQDQLYQYASQIIPTTHIENNLTQYEYTVNKYLTDFAMTLQDLTNYETELRKLKEQKVLYDMYVRLHNEGYRPNLVILKDCLEYRKAYIQSFEYDGFEYVEIKDTCWIDQPSVNYVLSQPNSARYNSSLYIPSLDLSSARLVNSARSDVSMLNRTYKQKYDLKTLAMIFSKLQDVIIEENVERNKIINEYNTLCIEDNIVEIDEYNERQDIIDDYNYETDALFSIIEMFGQEILTRNELMYDWYESLKRLTQPFLIDASSVWFEEKHNRIDIINEYNVTTSRLMSFYITDQIKELIVTENLERHKICLEYNSIYKNPIWCEHELYEQEINGRDEIIDEYTNDINDLLYQLVNLEYNIRNCIESDWYRGFVWIYHINALIYDEVCDRNKVIDEWNKFPSKINAMISLFNEEKISRMDVENIDINMRLNIVSLMENEMRKKLVESADYKHIVNQWNFSNAHIPDLIEREQISRINITNVELFERSTLLLYQEYMNRHSIEEYEVISWNNIAKLNLHDIPNFCVDEYNARMGILSSEHNEYFNILTKEFIESERYHRLRISSANIYDIIVIDSDELSGRSNIEIDQRNEKLKILCEFEEESRGMIVKEYNRTCPLPYVKIPKLEVLLDEEYTKRINICKEWAFAYNNTESIDMSINENNSRNKIVNEYNSFMHQMFNLHQIILTENRYRNKIINLYDSIEPDRCPKCDMFIVLNSKILDSYKFEYSLQSLQPTKMFTNYTPKPMAIDLSDIRVIRMWNPVATPLTNEYIIYKFEKDKVIKNKRTYMSATVSSSIKAKQVKQVKQTNPTSLKVIGNTIYVGYRLEYNPKPCDIELSTINIPLKNKTNYVFMKLFDNFTKRNDEITRQPVILHAHERTKLVLNRLDYNAERFPVNIKFDVVSTIPTIKPNIYIDPIKFSKISGKSIMRPTKVNYEPYMAELKFSRNKKHTIQPEFMTTKMFEQFEPREVIHNVNIFIPDTTQYRFVPIVPMRSYDTHKLRNNFTFLDVSIYLDRLSFHTFIDNVKLNYTVIQNVYNYVVNYVSKDFDRLSYINLKTNAIKEFNKYKWNCTFTDYIKSLTNLNWNEKCLAEYKNLCMHFTTNVFDDKRYRNFMNFPYNTCKKVYDDIVKLKEQLSVIRQSNNNIIRQKTFVETIMNKVKSAEMSYLNDSIGYINRVANIILKKVIPVPVEFKLYLTGERVVWSLKLNGYDRYNIRSLSGGEQDKISFALTIAISRYISAKIIIFDESFNSMDLESRTACLSIFKNTNAFDDMHIIMISHDQLDIQANEVIMV